MNPIPHILISLNVGYLYSKLFCVYLRPVLVFLLSVLAGWLLLDMWQVVGMLLNKPDHHLRCFHEDPLGLILYVIPLSRVWKFLHGHHVSLLSILLSVLHILLDFVTVPHTMGLLDPLLHNVYEVRFGVFQSVWYFGKPEPQALVSEVYFTVFLAFLTCFCGYKYQQCYNNKRIQRLVMTT
ncbi:hypothetical protein P9112_008158 [Eukaryota sp. TZLM1-RC]